MTEASKITETVPADGKFQTITLMEPLVRGDTTFEKLTLRRPGSGELRGLNLQDIYTLDVAALLTILTRISDPILTAEEANRLSPPDLMEIGAAIKGFFMTAAEREAMENLIQDMTGVKQSSS